MQQAGGSKVVEYDARRDQNAPKMQLDHVLATKSEIC